MGKNQPKVEVGKTRCFNINLRNPESTEWGSIRKYLKEILSGKKVKKVNPIIWKIILTRWLNI